MLKHDCMILMTVLILGIMGFQMAYADQSASELMSIINGSYQNMQSTYAANKENFMEIQERIAGLRAYQDPDARIVYVIETLNKIDYFFVTMGTIDGEKQKLLSNITALKRLSTVSSADSEAVSRYEREQAFWWNDLEAMGKKVGEYQRGLNRELASLPPPECFTGEFGINMILVKPRRSAEFYISSSPISEKQYKALCRFRVTGDRNVKMSPEESQPQGNITLDEAVNCVNDLSKYEGERYNLLTDADVKILKKMNFEPADMAYWVLGKYTRDNTMKMQMSSFGIDMVEIWDPKFQLRQSDHSGDDIFAEFPDAKYPKLGIYVTIDAASGKRIYFEQICRRNGDWRAE